MFPLIPATNSLLLYPDTFLLIYFLVIFIFIGSKTITLYPLNSSDTPKSFINQNGEKHSDWTCTNEGDKMRNERKRNHNNG